MKKFTWSFCGLLFIFVGSLGWAKTHPYDAQFAEKVEMLFFDKGQLSQQKVGIYVKRLLQKRREVVGIENGRLLRNSILISKYRSEGRAEAEILQKVQKHEVTYAFDEAIGLISALPMARSQEDFMSMAYHALDLEAAIRIEGKLLPLDQIKEIAEAVLVRWHIPRESKPEDEASNLINPKTGEYFDVQDIADLKRRGVDLSQFNPQSDSTFWENPGDVSKVDVRAAAQGKNVSLYDGVKVSFPKENVLYYDGVKYSDTKPKMDVYAKDSKGDKHEYKLKIGAEVHADPTLTALMHTLGFPTDITKYTRNVKVILGKTPISKFKRDWEVYYKRDNLRLRYHVENYIIDEGTTPEGDNYVVFKDGLLEAKPSKIERLGPWAYGDNSHNSFREVRGLMWVQIWLDNSDVPETNNNRILLKKVKDPQTGEASYRKYHTISDPGKAMGFIFGEKPEAYFWNVIEKSDSRGLTLNYLSMPTKVKNKITWDDARWATRLIAGLTREQITQAVALGGWPQCVAEIYVEKMISRRNDFVRGLGLEGERLENGEVITLLPQGDRDQFKFDSRCNEEQIKKDYTTDLDFNLGFLLEPVGKAAWHMILDTARGALNGMERIKIKSDEFKLDLGPVADIVFDPRREIERNPNPTSEKDIFIVKDYMRIGFRYGVKYGVYADQVYSVAFSIAYPARSMEEARLNNGFLVNALLPLDVINNKLPESYVLMVEHAVETGGGVNSGHLLAPVPLELEKSRHRVVLHRTVFDRRDPNNSVVYRDRAGFTQDAEEVELAVGIVEFPIYEAIRNWGHALGKGFQFSTALEPKMDEQVIRAMLNGDFSKFRLREKDFYLSNKFRSSMKTWSLIFIGGDSEKRLENITVTQSDEKKSVLQYRSHKSRSWNFLGNGERRSVKVEVYTDPLAASAQYQLNLNVVGMDKNTRDKELGQNYLFFINGLSTDGQPIIPFSPELSYTVNGKWGHLITTSDTFYYQEGIDRILRMTDYEFWKALADSMNVSYGHVQDLYKRHQIFEGLLRARQGNTTRSVIYRKAGITREQNDLMEHAAEFLARLKKIRKEVELEEKVRYLAEAFRKAAFKYVDDFYEPRIIGALNRVAGAENFYSRNVITTPEWTEVNMIEEVPLFGEFGVRRSTSLQYLMYTPVTAVDLYTMFDSWF